MGILSLNTLVPVFTSGRSRHFFTVKGEGKYQKIDTIDRLCRKISRTYVVVREANKKSVGYHFHALLKDCKKPPKNFFKKGVHMNLQKVGGDVVIRLVGGVRVVAKPDTAHLLEMTVDKAIEHVALQKVLDKGTRDRKVVLHVSRVLHYMSKDLELPAQYTDYIYKHSGKSVKLF